MHLNLSSGGFVAPVAVTGTAVAVVFTGDFLNCVSPAPPVAVGLMGWSVWIFPFSFSPSPLVTATLGCCGGTGGFCTGGPLCGFSALLLEEGRIVRFIVHFDGENSS